jgi:hypothetical protein
MLAEGDAIGLRSIREVDLSCRCFSVVALCFFMTPIFAHAEEATPSVDPDQTEDADATTAPEVEEEEAAAVENDLPEVHSEDAEAVSAALGERTPPSPRVPTLSGESRVLLRRFEEATTLRGIRLLRDVRDGDLGDLEQSILVLRHIVETHDNQVLRWHAFQALCAYDHPMAVETVENENVRESFDRQDSPEYRRWGHFWRWALVNLVAGAAMFIPGAIVTAMYEPTLPTGWVLLGSGLIVTQLNVAFFVQSRDNRRARSGPATCEAD